MHVSQIIGVLVGVIFVAGTCFQAGNWAKENEKKIVEYKKMDKAEGKIHEYDNSMFFWLKSFPMFWIGLLMILISLITL